MFTVVLGVVLALVQALLGAERRQGLAVVFDCVSRQWKRICDDDKILLSLIAVSVDDAYLPATVLSVS